MTFDNITELDVKTTCLFLDLDGTLIDLAEHPDAVFVPPELPGDLNAMARSLRGALALVSGRAIDVIDRLTAPESFPAAGAHGAQLRVLRGGDIQLQGATATIPDYIRDRLMQLAGEASGLLAEDKGVSIAIHYRANKPFGPVLADRLARIADDADFAACGLMILPGHFVFEVKPAAVDKGTAITAFLAQPPFAGRRPVFIGDDVTDEAGFAAVNAAGGLAISVGRDADGAHRLFESAADVRSWLGRQAQLAKVAA